MHTLNTAGNYTLELTNVTAGASCLDTPPFDMNTLVAATVTDMTLTGVAANLDFAAKEVWEISLASDNVGFDGTEVYIGLRFGVS